MALIVARVHTVVDVIAMLTQALSDNDVSQLDALSRKVNDWIMLDSEKEVILAHIAAVEETLASLD